MVQLHVDSIRAQYTSYWSSKEQRKQQMGVALYFIDKLALRAGHEKDEDEADTVGCCTLKVGPCPSAAWQTSVQVFAQAAELECHTASCLGGRASARQQLKLGLRQMLQGANLVMHSDLR